MCPVCFIIVYGIENIINSNALHLLEAEYSLYCDRELIIMLFVVFEISFFYAANGAMPPEEFFFLRRKMGGENNDRHIEIVEIN